MDRKLYGWWVSFAVLAATLAFAMWVIQYKRSASKLTLTTAVAFDDHRLAMRIGDGFDAIDADTLPKDVLAGWVVRSPGSPTMAIFAARVANSSQIPNQCAIGAVLRYVRLVGQLADTEITQSADTVDGFSRVSVAARYVTTEREVGMLAIEILLLPDGSAMEVAVAGSGRTMWMARSWADTLVQSVKYNLPETITIVPAHAPIVLGGWQTTTERSVAMTTEADGQTLRLTADSVRADEFWTAQVRAFHLPAFRDAQALVREAIADMYTLDTPIAVAPPETHNGLTLYRADQTNVFDQRMKIAYRQRAMAVVAENRSCLLISVTVAGDNVEAIEKFWTWTIGNLRCVKATPMPPMLKVTDVLAKSTLATLATNVTGWYEFVHEGESVGFCLLAVEPTSNDAVRARYFWYRDLGNSNVYLSQETATLKEFGKTMTSSARDVQRIVRDKRLITTAVGKRISAEVQTLSIESVVQQQKTSARVTRRSDFADTTAQLLIGSAAATSNLLPLGKFSYSTVDDFGATPASGTMIVQRKDGQTRVTYAGDTQLNPGAYVYDAAGQLQVLDFDRLKIRRSSAEQIRARFPRGSYEAMQWMQSDQAIDIDRDAPATSTPLDAPPSQKVSPKPRRRIDDPRGRTDAGSSKKHHCAAARSVF